MMMERVVEFEEVDGGEYFAPYPSQVRRDRRQPIEPPLEHYLASETPSNLEKSSIKHSIFTLVGQGKHPSSMYERHSSSQSTASTLTHLQIPRASTNHSRCLHMVNSNPVLSLENSATRLNPAIQLIATSQSSPPTKPFSPTSKLKTSKSKLSLPANPAPSSN
jgi:hypothetical protein